MAGKLGYYIGGGLVAACIAAGVVYLLIRDVEPTVTPIGPVLTANGFVELRPPSTFFSPGTWVQIVQQDPLHLSVVCGPIDALGTEGTSGNLTSPSLSVELVSKLSPEFSVDASTLKSWQAKGSLKAVRSVKFSLSNVKLVEIPDNLVLKGFKSRTKDCNDAITLRIGAKKSVSMIKSILIADVTYDVQFDGDVAADAKAEAISDLALSLGTKVKDENSTHLEGKELVFGIRDDVVLATFGYKLPDTGGVEKKSILLDKGPIIETQMNEQVRRTFQDRTAFSAYDVQPLKQATVNSCWATVYTMMKSWKDKKPWSVTDALKELGPTYVQYFVEDTGLPGGGEQAFVQQTDMIAEPPANYTLHGFTEMMKSSGPLWITLGDGVSSHALLLVGIYGKAYEESRAAYDDTVFEFIDPLTGTYKYLSAMEFMAEFEREAGAIVNSGADNLDLRWQVIHWKDKSAT